MDMDWVERRPGEYVLCTMDSVIEKSTIVRFLASFKRGKHAEIKKKKKRKKNAAF